MNLFLYIKKILLLFSLTVLVGGINAQIASKVQYFKLQDVELLDSPFKHACNLDKKYLLELEADRLLAPFIREANLTPKADSYTNWENSGLDGHIGGHYLSGLSLMYASTGDNQVKERLDYMLSELKRVQDANADGYIGGVPGSKKLWAEISEGNIKAGGFSLNDRWVPLYNIHKTYAGLRDAYLHADSDLAKEMLVKMTDWMITITQNLSDEQMQDMLRSEHGGLNETFADVAAITGDEKYLQLAHRFSHNFLLEPLLAKEDKLTGMHANTQIPKVLGFKRVADVEGNENWSDAAQFFWQTVTDHRSVCTGGNSVSEHFNPVNDYSRMVQTIEGPETCNTYNMLRLSKMFYGTSLEKKYIEYYERALYNHILTTQNPRTGGFVYFTQMRPGHYRVYSQPHTSMWCCVGSGLENHAKYSEMIYAHSGNDVYVNLFIPSKLNWKEKATEISMTTNFPEEELIHFVLNPKKAISFSLNLRCPDWANKNDVEILVNGKKETVNISKNGYIVLNRKWKTEDKITLKLPMNIRVEQMPDKSNYYAFFYGPVVLAAKTNVEDQKGLFADDSRGGHIAHGNQIPLRNIPILLSDANNLVSNITPIDKKNLTFSLSKLVSEKFPETMELIPFYRLHESRYIIYWPQANKEELEILKRKIAYEEAERIKLDGITIDKVVCGEQQPESDHFFKSDNSYAGFFQDVHWRETRGWFSYQMKNSSKNAKFLYLKYFDRDKNRKFDLLINDIKIESMSLPGEHGENLQTKVLEIPASETGKEILEIKIAAQSNSMSSKIAELRILNSK